ncbi:MAG: efflux RND transporter periplasmic adaptor subunit, partial [Bradyrhizobium sp.]
MSEVRVRIDGDGLNERPDADSRIVEPPGKQTRPRRRYGGVWFGAAMVLLVAGGLSLGGWRHYQAARELADSAEQAR